MYYICDAVQYWAYSRLQNDKKYRNVDIRISGPDVPGEGELKIIDFCRSDGFPASDSIVVVGGDADIVLQGLATAPTRNFFVFLRHFNTTGKKKENYVLSVWETIRVLEGMFPHGSAAARLDLIVLAVLTGNGMFFYCFLGTFVNW